MAPPNEGAVGCGFLQFSIHYFNGSTRVYFRRKTASEATAFLVSASFLGQQEVGGGIPHGTASFPLP